MKSELMVRMANQIAIFFASYEEDEAVAGIADHLKKFWEPRMLRQIFEYVDDGGQGLDRLVVAAVALLRRQDS